MSTHEHACIVCDKPSWCSDEGHVLGVGDGCYGPHPMEFCSVECFVDLRERIEARIDVVRSFPDSYPVVAEKLRALIQ